MEKEVTLLHLNFHKMDQIKLELAIAVARVGCGWLTFVFRLPETRFYDRISEVPDTGSLGLDNRAESFLVK